MKRAFGITATDDRTTAGAIAIAAEEAGYSTIWTNDGVADGVSTASWMARATEHIRVGIGVVACDRVPAKDLAEKITSLELPLDRCVIGIGSGFSSRPLTEVREAVEVLRGAFAEELTIAVAAMGPQMCRLAGEISDVVLLNWMTPQRIIWARQQISGGGRSRIQQPVVAGYVRVAVGPGASQRIATEANRYASIPHYAAHFRAMGRPPEEVGIAGEPEELRARLDEYDEILDQVVVRGVPASLEPESTLQIVRAAAPK